MAKGRILGIDYGMKRIGIAVSDPLGIIAQGLPTIVYNKLSEALNKIDTVVSEYQIRKVVVGYPLSLNGTHNIAAERTDKFIYALKQKISVPVLTWDERLTSVQSERILITMGKSPSKNRKRVDQLSASILLQGYLDRLHSRGT